MFINFSNHSSDGWEAKQIKAASLYGEIVDIPFPGIPAEEDEDYIASLARHYARLFREQYCPERDVFHIMGEMCFSFALIRQLRAVGFTCVASTSERVVREDGKGHKEAYFSFIRFRKYD